VKLPRRTFLHLDAGAAALLLVSYRGVAPAVTDLRGGQVQVMFNSLPASIECIKAGTLRALAVTTATRSELLRDIPTMSEFLPGYEASQWYGIGAPKNTPNGIINKLNKEINAALADPIRCALPIWVVRQREADTCQNEIRGADDHQVEAVFR
jgi:tripartite-type tricarboxylate transporter receptor subunit TctC